MTCPYCNHELSAEKIRALWASYNGSKTTDVKRKSSAENGKKGGRPKKKPEGDIKKLVQADSLYSRDTEIDIQSLIKGD